MTAAAEPRPIDRLLAIMARLRDRDDGCPWDREQNFATIAPYTIEEAYEVADTIARGDWDSLKDELGDLLLQVVFHARMAEEEALFGFDDVVTAICEKMERRHPHIFGAVDASDSNTVTSNWESIKAAERAGKGHEGLLADIPLALPSLLRAHKLQKRAARIGFDWPDATGARSKIDEELDEVAAAQSRERIEEEVGDLLFSVVNYARHLGIEPEAALRLANRKFERRFRRMEALSDNSLDQKDLDELEALWVQAKSEEKPIKP